MALAAPRAKLFHTIVVVGLSTASAGCGASELVDTSKDAAEDARADAAASVGNVTAPDAPAEAASVVLTGTDASAEAVAPLPADDAGDAGDAGLDCGPAANPAYGRCWPIYV